MDKIIPFRPVQVGTRSLSIKRLSKVEKEALEQFLQVLRKGSPAKRDGLRKTVQIYFNTLPGEKWGKQLK